jgi:hypothetical protein
MKWLKQTFAIRYNRDSGRTGHLWGDRYRSRILEGEPPDGGVSPVTTRRLAGRTAAGGPPTHGRVRPYRGKRAAGAEFSRLYPLTVAPAPG